MFPSPCGEMCFITMETKIKVNDTVQFPSPCGEMCFITTSGQLNRKCLLWVSVPLRGDVFHNEKLICVFEVDIHSVSVPLRGDVFHNPRL